ncbi:4'-phosphopantetheinyl transferase superfamily protein [Eubacteriales bacterium OttesenSCG-928-M02]|nr:4'-phosphopantetheinyl transferase superfamily protein [Eubacteriales bacterium OttesenSCG-928-M02]
MMTKVYYTQMIPIHPRVYRTWMDGLHEEKRRRTEGQKGQRQLAALFGDRLLRYAWQQHFGMDAPFPSIVEDEKGKPSFSQYPGHHFNISHSGAVVVVAVSPHPVGVDVEMLRSPKDRVAQRMFSQEEYEGYLEATDKERRFFQLWTLKESYAKCLGEGIRMDFKRISFSITTDGIGANVPRHFQLFEDIPGYQAAVCYEMEGALWEHVSPAQIIPAEGDTKPLGDAIL